MTHDDIVAEAMADSKDKKSRRWIWIFGILTVVGLIVSAIDLGAVYSEKQSQVDAGRDLALQVQTACRDNVPDTVDLQKICEQANRVEKQTSQGPQGLPGVQGPRGPQGIQGPVGPMGFQGIQGLPGDTGSAGQNGKDGANGVEGPRGDQGLQGLQGTPGVKGKQGDTGATGPQGAAGTQGSPGATGPKGDTGATGPMGPSTFPFSFVFQMSGATYHCTITSSSSDAICTTERARNVRR